MRRVVCAQVEVCTPSPSVRAKTVNARASARRAREPRRNQTANYSKRRPCLEKALCGNQPSATAQCGNSTAGAVGCARCDVFTSPHVKTVDAVSVTLLANAALPWAAASAVQRGGAKYFDLRFTIYDNGPDRRSGVSLVLAAWARCRGPRALADLQAATPTLAAASVAAASASTFLPSATKPNVSSAALESPNVGHGAVGMERSSSRYFTVREASQQLMP